MGIYFQFYVVEFQHKFFASGCVWRPAPVSIIVHIVIQRGFCTSTIRKLLLLVDTQWIYHTPLSSINLPPLSSINLNIFHEDYENIPLSQKKKLSSCYIPGWLVPQNNAAHPQFLLQSGIWPTERITPVVIFRNDLETLQTSQPFNQPMNWWREINLLILCQEKWILRLGYDKIDNLAMQ